MTPTAPHPRRRVLLVSCIADVRWSGMGRWTQAVREELTARGFIVDAWFADRFPRLQSTGRWTVLLFPLALAWHLVAQRDDYDIVVIHEPSGFWYGLARHVWRRLPPMIAMCHNVESHCFQQLLRYAAQGLARISLGGRLKAPLIRLWQSRGAIRLADHVVCLSATDVDYVTGPLRVPPARVTHVLNGTSPDDFLPRAERTGGHAVLWVGGWLDIKGRRVLPPLWRRVRERVPDATLTLVGTGADPSSVLAAFDAGDRGSITVRPRVEGPDAMRACYAAAQLYLMTSLSEGSPLSLLEALAAGVPAVVTSVGGIPDLVTDDVHALLFHPGEPDHGAALASRVLEQRDEAERLAAAGQARARELSWARTAATLASAITRTLQAAGDD